MGHRPGLNLSAYWLGSAILVMAVFLPELAHAQILDKVGSEYQSASKQWEMGLTIIAKGLFLKLALLEIVWSAIWWVLERDDPNQIIVAMLKKIMSLMFFWAILLNFDTWIPAVIDGFAQSGQIAAKTGPLTPSEVLDRGLMLATKVASASNKAGLFSKAGLGSTILSGLSAIIILLTFAVIAGQMLITLIESYIVVSGGVLFLGFAGSRWTTTFAEKYLSYSVSVGVKLFVMYLIIGAGQKLTNSWGDLITPELTISDYMEVVAGSLVYMFLAWQIPSLASSMLTGAVSMTLGSAAATVATVAAGAAGAAGAAAAGVAGAGNGVAGAIQAGSAAIDQARAGGASGFAGIAKGAIGALASAGAGAASDTISGLGGGSTGGNLANRMAGTTAALNETAAAGSPASSVPGSQPAAPAAPTAPAASPAAAPGGAPSSSPGGDSAGQRATPPVPQSALIDTSGNISQALAERGSGAAAAPAVPQAASLAPSQSPMIDTSGNISQALADRDSGLGAAQAASDAESTSSAPAPAAPATSDSAAPTPAAPATSASAAPTPAAPAAANVSGPDIPQSESRSKSFSEHASALGKIPDDSGGAAVQINLKLD